MVDPDYSGRFTVPVLYDKQQKVIVNNESSEILRMLNSEFNDFCKLPEQAAIDLYPEPLRAEVDTLNDWIYPWERNHFVKKIVEGFIMMVSILWRS